MPAKKSNFTTTEIKAGLMVLASVFVLVAFVVSIRGCGSRGEERNRFSADFTSIIGLDMGADVRFGGVEAGKVVGIEPDPDDHSRIRVVFEVPVSTPAGNHGSVASIEQISLTTAKHLEVSTGGKDQPLHISGDRITSRTNSGGLRRDAGSRRGDHSSGDRARRARRIVGVERGAGGRCGERGRDG